MQGDAVPGEPSGGSPVPVSETAGPGARSLTGRRVLVTGATGFVGGHLTRRLLADGARVGVLVRASSDPATVDGLERAGAEVARGDVTDPESVLRAAEGVEVVFHVAALFREARHPDEVYHRVNVEGVRNVLEAARREGARVVHCSTIGVHSHIPRPPANEDEPFRPGDVYQVSKAEGELLARSYFDAGRVEGVVIRPAMIWGAGDRRILKLFRGVARRRFPIIGSGRVLTHWIDVEDLAEAFVLAATVPEASGRTYIIAGERPVTLRHVVATIARLAGVEPLPLRIPARPMQWLGSLTEAVCRPLGVEPPLYRRRIDFFTKDRAFDTTRARTELGFRPRSGFEAETQRLFRWYERQGWLA
ncbi:MAG: NAD-dependent epimerase/dehydratase family protein [Gemmatimonadota bacterium]